MTEIADLVALLPPWPVMVAIAGVGVVAGLIRGVTGFGAALVMVPGLALFLPPAEAIVVNLVALTATNLPMLASARRNVDVKLAGTLFLGCAVALPFGVWVLMVVEAEDLRRAIGAAVILAALLLSRPSFRLASASFGLKGVTGAFSGLMNGAVGMGGPPVILLLLALPIPPAVTRATLIMFFTLQNLFSLSLMGFEGLVQTRLACYALVIIPPLLVASKIGEALFNRGWSTHFRPIAIGILILTGIAALWRG